MLVRNITKQDKLQTMKISSVCFEYPFSTNGMSEEEFLDNIFLSPKEKLHAYWDSQLVVYDDNNDFMACMAAMPFTFYFEGKTYCGNGIGNVCTYPHHRKKGAIKAMFEKMLIDSYQHNQVFSYLYPFSESFYGKFGYARQSNSKFYEFRLLGFPDTPYDGTFHLLEETSPKLLDDFKNVYESFAVNYNLMVSRDAFDWGNVTDAKAYSNNNYAYLYKDKNGIPAGYLVFKKDGRSLRCRELVFNNFSTLQAIFSFIKTYSTDYDTFRFHLPASVHMEYFCTDFSRYPAEMKVVSNGVVRVINVKTVLEQARYLGDGSIRIKINDPWIPQNNGLFTITFTNGSADHVTFLPATQNEFSDFDIAMPISLFSSAIVGNYEVRDFDYMTGLEIKGNVELLKQVFYKKSCFINNYF